jgi:UDPglucose 6-dehydrogenase
LICDKLALYRPNETFEVLSNPEFLAEGSAIPDLCNPDRILIGSAPTASGRAAANVLRNVYSSWVDPSKILTVNVWSSELAKLVANAMLAQRISSINTISAICDQTGADVDEIARAVGLDSRLGAKFLRAGIGFGGSCFKKDILSLIYLARSLHLPEVGNYWESVLAVNEFQMDRFTRRVVSKLHGALTGKKIAVLGFTFKENTNDTRESPSINVIKAVLSERPSEIAIFDPGCTALEVKELISLETSTTTDRALKPDGPIEAYANAYEACRNSSAVLIMTPWSQFYYPQSNLQTATRAPLDLIRTENAQGPRSDTEGLTNWTDRLVSESECAENCILCLEAAKPSYSEAHKNVDWGLIASSMQEPKWVFDGRNIVDKKAMATLGFRVESLGKSRV